MSILQGLVSNNGLLYALWKGEPDDDRIFFSSWSGSGKWKPAVTIGGNTSTGPALAASNGSVFAAWKGEWSDPRLFFARLEGSSWGAQAQIPNIYSNVGPALGAQGGKLIAAWKNAFDQNLFYASYDGSSWSAQTQIPGTGSSVGPALASLGNTLYAAWKGADSDQGIYYASFNGTNWTAQTQIPGVASSVGPSLAAIGSKLYAVWKGQSGDQSLWYAVFDGSKWSAQTKIPSATSSVGAAIAEFNGQLFAMWKGASADVSLHNSTLDGTKWSTPATDIPGNTGPDPTSLLSVPPGGNGNYFLADGKGASLTGTTFTVLVTEDIVPENGEPFAFQFNCDGPAQSSGPDALVWQQFLIVATQNELCALVNSFRAQDLAPGTPFLQWDSRPKAGNTAFTGVVPLPQTDNRLPKGWRLSLTLTTDSADRVTAFSFSIAQPNGDVLNSPSISLLSLNAKAVSANLAPIVNVTALPIKNNGGTTTDFSEGQGIFQVFATNDLTASLTPDGSGVRTAENSNVGYSSLPASYPNGEFYQLFGIGLVA